MKMTNLGCNEYPHNTLIQPRATEANTGPSYDSSTATGIGNNTIVVTDLIQVSPNPVSNEISIKLYTKSAAQVVIDIIDITGTRVSQMVSETQFSGVTTYTQDMSALPAGIYMIHASSRSIHGGDYQIQTSKVIKL